MNRISHRGIFAPLAAACMSLFGTASGAPFQDVLVQSPSIGTPQRGSVAGTLSRLAFGPGDLARGAFALPLPISVPGERGPLLANVFPSYSPEAGITEWGVGWQTELKIQRFQPRGEVSFLDDELTSPWGHLVRGSDGNYYPLGMTSVTRVIASAGGWIAQSSDGTRYMFDIADSVVTAKGTFAWMLSRVDNVLGDSTVLSWARNPSGRPFLSSVRWGGRGDGTQYQLTFAYEPVDHPFLSYLSGEPQLLDQRITQVTVGVKQGASYALRWRYELAYTPSPSGPAYYLHQITKHYASGDAEPPVTYTYDLNTELWGQTQLVHTPGLDDFIATNGSTAIQPDHAVLIDLEGDGMPDLETAFDQTTVRQTATGYVIEPLPPAPGATDDLCRPAPSQFNKPRRLARMHGDAAEPQVVVLQKIGFGGSTRMLVCDRLGIPIFDQSIADDWALSATTRLADIDLDQRPDVVRVSAGEVAVLHNTSSGPNELSFEPGPVTTLSPQVSPVAAWVLDLNGDSRTDLMVKHSNGVLVWFGTGHGAFESEGQNFSFITEAGTQLGGLSTYQFSFGDFNGDGLSDVLLSQGQTLLVFTNTGSEFREVSIPGLQGVPWTVTFPVIADLAGTGNESAVFINGDQAFSIQLTSPSTGLLRSADDGKGTVVQFGYGHVPGHPGLVHRYATLSDLTIASSGYDTVTYRYEYGTPVVHTLGKYLVGFVDVDKHAPALSERMTFRNSDDFAGVRELAEDTDQRSPGIVRFTQRHFDDVRYRNVRWLRPTSIETGYRSIEGLITLSTTTEVTAYERELCPTRAVTTGPNGQLTKMTALATVAAIPDDLHCLPRSQSLTGTHPDSALDFNYLAEVARNDLGQMTRVTQYGASVDLQVLQEITYTADHRVATIGSPGHGTTVASYDAHGQLTSITDPMGVVTQVTATDPVSDALLAIQTLRPEAPSTAYFEYDTKERLQATWDDVSGSSQAYPLQRYTYQFATSTAPGMISTETLADAITRTSRRTFDLIAADGETMVSGTSLGDHVALGTATITTRNTLTTRSSVIGVMTETALASLTSADLRALGTTLVDTVRSGFGHPVQTTMTHQVNVVGTTAQELVLGSGELITRTQQPGGFTAETAVDAAGNVVRSTDENGVTHRFSYDALGRLVRVETPDGGQRLAFDGFGRPARISRDGIGAITFAYDPTSGLLVRKQRLDATGAVTDTNDVAYDAIGRHTQIAQTSGDDHETVSYDYDGQLGNTTVGGQLGRQSHVRGDGWERSELFDPLGRAFEQRVALTGWRDVTCNKTYRPDGSVASDTLTVADAGGDVRLSLTKETVLDELGRVSALKVNGAVLYTLSYDAEGRLARASFASGDTVTFDFDAVTHRRRGHQLTGPHATGGVSWDHDARGLIAGETYTIAGNPTRRDYSYDGRGAVTRAATPTSTATYSYTASGLPESTTDLAGTRTVHPTSLTLDAGGVVYTWDDAGRVVGKGPWRFIYGANGQLIRASRPGREITYAYDDSHHRLLKRIDGVPVRAEVAGGVLTEDDFAELVTVGGVVAGVLDNGVFSALPSDPRGTPFIGPDGTPGLATVYGVRSAPLGYADVIDYVQLGRDTDLDVVRLGVRDYDPQLGQFLTPDPLFFENLEKCVDSPLECSLYGYASGNPLSFVDPSGMNESFFEWLLPRTQGGLDILAGWGIAAAGVAMCTTIVGCVVGGLAIAYGAAVAANGAEEVITGELSHNQFNQAIASVSNQQTADNFDLAINAVMLGHALSKSPYFGPPEVGAPSAEPPRGGPGESGGAGEPPSVPPGTSGGGGSAADGGLAFSQTTASATFSEEGTFAGETIGSLAAKLRGGGVSPTAVPVSYITMEGNNLIVNTRSSLALTRAGIPPSSWMLLDATATEAANIEARLLRNGLTPEGTDVLRITGAGPTASSLR